MCVPPSPAQAARDFKCVGGMLFPVVCFAYWLGTQLQVRSHLGTPLIPSVFNRGYNTLPPLSSLLSTVTWLYAASLEAAADAADVDRMPSAQPRTKSRHKLWSRDCKRRVCRRAVPNISAFLPGFSISPCHESRRTTNRAFGSNAQSLLCQKTLLSRSFVLSPMAPSLWV